MTPQTAVQPPSSISVVLYRDQESAADPRPISTTWDGLVGLLVDSAETSPCTAADGPSKCVGKKCPYKSHSSLPPSADNFMCWSPVQLAGTRRLDKNVVALTVLVLDYDHLESSAADAVCAVFEGWDHVVHTTHSHRPGTPGDHCLRVVVRLSRPVLAAQWHRFLPAAIAYWPDATILDRDGIRQPDRTCKDRSRQYYLPSHPSDVVGFARRGTGRTLDVDAVLAWADANLAAPAAAWAANLAMPASPLPAEAKWDLEGDAVIGAIDAIARHFPARRRHELALALSGDLRRRGATQEDARYILWESFRDGGSDDPAKRVTAVDHTWQLGDDAVMTGFATMCDILGVDEAEEIGDFLTEARLEVELRGFRPSTGLATPLGLPDPTRLPEVLATATITRAGAPLPVFAPVTIDLAELRAAASSVASARARAETRDERIDAILLRRCLDGRPPTHPGDVETFYDETETAITPKSAIGKVARMLAFGLPLGTPWEAVAELLRPSLVNPQGGDWLERARRVYNIATSERLVGERDRAAAEEARRAAALQAYLGPPPAVPPLLPPPLPPEALLVAPAPLRPAHTVTQRAVLTPSPSNWRDRLKKGAAGVTASCLYNVQVLLEHDENLRGSLRWNEHDKVLEVIGGALGRYQTQGAESIVTGVQNYLEEIWGVSVPHRDLARRVMLVARECGYDPLAEHLMSLQWDSQRRIDTFLPTYFGVEDTPHYRRIGWRWLVGSVARALEPGCKFDCVLIFEGLTGAFKSNAFEALGGAFYTSTEINVKDKDAKMLASCTWLVELAELDIRGNDNNAVKGFLSRRWDHYRAPFAVEHRRTPRRCVFVGSTNEDRYLSDATGNRRYWPARCGVIALAALLRDAPQIWAEAVTIYLSYKTCADCAASTDTVFGQHPRCAAHRWWLDQDEEKEAAAVVGGREEDAPWMAWQVKILAWWRGLRSRGPDYEFTAIDVALGVGDLEPDRVTKPVTTQIGIALKRMGFIRNESRRTYRAGPAMLRDAPGKGLFSIPGGKSDDGKKGEGEK